jgi:hypothetical protein
MVVGNMGFQGYLSLETGVGWTGRKPIAGMTTDAKEQPIHEL